MAIKIGTIYEIINISNQKRYIGQTSRKLYERWNEHKTKLNRNKHQNSYLQNDYNNYNHNNFKINIIEQIKYNELEMLELEKFWISSYHTKFNEWGYNIQENLLSQQQIEEIRNKYQIDRISKFIGKYNFSQLAKEYNVSRQLISDVIKNTSYYDPLYKPSKYRRWPLKKS